MTALPGLLPLFMAAAQAQRYQQSYNTALGINQQGIDNGNLRQRNYQFAQQLADQEQQRQIENQRADQSFQAAQKNVQFQQQMEQTNELDRQRHQQAEDQYKTNRLKQMQQVIDYNEQPQAVDPNSPEAQAIQAKATEAQQRIELNNQKIAAGRKAQNDVDQRDLITQHLNDYTNSPEFQTDDAPTTALTIAKITGKPEHAIEAKKLFESNQRYQDETARKTANDKAAANYHNFMQRVASAKLELDVNRFNLWVDTESRKALEDTDKNDRELKLKIISGVGQAMLKAHEEDPTKPLPWSGDAAAQEQFFRNVEAQFKIAKKAQEDFNKGGNQPSRPLPPTKISPFQFVPKPEEPEAVDTAEEEQTE